MLSIRLSSISAKRFPAGKATHRPFLDRSRPCRLCSGVRLVSARGRGWDAGCRAPRRRPACLVRRRIIPAPAAIRARRALPSSPPPALNRRKAAGAFSQRGFVAHPTVACCAHDAPPRKTSCFASCRKQPQGPGGGKPDRRRHLRVESRMARPAGGELRGRFRRPANRPRWPRKAGFRPESLAAPGVRRQRAATRDGLSRPSPPKKRLA